MKNHKNTFLVWTLLLCAFNSLSQPSSNVENCKVIGKLLDLSQSEVMYASVALIGNDSTVLDGTITDPNGDFRIGDIQPGTYRLRIEHIEYQTFATESFTLSPDETKVFSNIILQRSINELGEVVVIHRKPLIEVKANKLIFNVSSSPSASGTNGLNLLKRSPGVTVDMDNRISLLGKSGVQIYINGVRSRLSGNDLTILLESMTSDNIEAIEMISNPSSKYEAEGNAGIINIRMKRNSSFGFNGTGTSSFTRGKYLRYSNNLSLNYGAEKIRLNLDVSQSQNRIQDDISDIKIQNSAILDLDSRQVGLRRGINIGFGLEADIAKNQTLHFTGRSVINQSDNSLESQTDIYERNPKQLSKILLSESHVDLPSENYNFNLNHIWNFDKTTSINSALSLGIFKNETNTQQPNTLFGADGSSIQLIDNTEFDANTNIDLWSAKTDFEKEWNNTTLSAGLKYSHISTRNDFDFYNFQNRQPVIDPTKSNDFNYTENIAALYAILNVNLSRSLKLNAGMRIENTASRGRLISDISIDNKDVPRNYTDLFPNIGLSYDNQNDHTWSMSVGRRITRPNYQDLNPFEKPISQLTVWKGNPFLRPNYIMNYQASYAYKSKLIVTNTYSVTKDFFANIFEITGENNNQIIPRNMDKVTKYGLSISYPLEVTKYWNLVSFIQGAFIAFEGDLEGTVIDLTAKTANFRIQNNIKLPGDILLDLTLFIRSEGVWRGSIRVEGTQNLSFGLRKNFLDGRLQVRMTGNDIFRTSSDYFYNGNYGGINIDGKRTFDNQRFGLGATFKFGNQKVKARRKTNSALDDELNRIEN